MWTSNDSRFVGLHTNWDDVHMHGNLGPPMYILWTKGKSLPQPGYLLESYYCCCSHTLFLFNRPFSC